MNEQSVGTAELNKMIDRLELLAARLERLSADSIYAHRASGYRGTILKILEHLHGHELSIDGEELQQIQALINQAFDIMTAAAREIA